MRQVEWSRCGAMAEVTDNGRYRFKESDLKNVVLVGIGLVKCGDCGNTDPVIPRTNDLMRVLAKERRTRRLLPDFASSKIAAWTDNSWQRQR